MTDGGAAVVIMSAAAAKAQGVKPLARLIGWASAGVDPRIMGIGPVPAVKKLLEKTGLSLEDFDLVELNEAFAAQVLAVLKDLPIPMEKLNVNGGAIALGHPIGCTGTRIVVTLLYEMMRRKARRASPRCVSQVGWGWRWGSSFASRHGPRLCTKARRHKKTTKYSLCLCVFVTFVMKPSVRV